jgi:hypothetical protein
MLQWRAAADSLVWYGTHLAATSSYFVAILPDLLAGSVGGGVGAAVALAAINARIEAGQVPGH